MAMRVRYTTHNGRLVGENRSGTKRDYVPDPLGSTVALLDGSQAQTDTFTSWPFGDERVRTGSNPAPHRFVGVRGYYRSSASRTYVRARFLRPDLGRWLTPDPAAQGAYQVNTFGYAAFNPTTFVDPPGLLLPFLLIAVLVGGGLNCISGSIIGNISTGGSGDAYKHCVIGCSITRNCFTPIIGQFVCGLAAPVKELADWICNHLPASVCGHGHGVEGRDIMNTLTGCGCGWGFLWTSCEDCCEHSGCEYR